MVLYLKAQTAHFIQMGYPFLVPMGQSKYYLAVRHEI